MDDYMPVKEAAKDRPLTRAQIQRKVNLLRLIMALMTKFKKTIGKEMFLNTGAGKVRVLAYNMDSPKNFRCLLIYMGVGS